MEEEDDDNEDNQIEDDSIAEPQHIEFAKKNTRVIKYVDFKKLSQMVKFDYLGNSDLYNSRLKISLSDEEETKQDRKSVSASSQSNMMYLRISK